MIWDRDVPTRHTEIPNNSIVQDIRPLSFPKSPNSSSCRNTLLTPVPSTTSPCTCSPHTHRGVSCITTSNQYISVSSQCADVRQGPLRGNKHCKQTIPVDANPSAPSVACPGSLLCVLSSPFNQHHNAAVTIQIPAVMCFAITKE